MNEYLKTNETLYDGFLAMVQAARRPGRTFPKKEMAAYEKLKVSFRYPGEVLERYQEHGYNKPEDTFSLLLAVVKTRIWETPGEETLFVGEQMADFLEKAKKECAVLRSPWFALMLYLAGEKEEEDRFIQYTKDMEDKEFLSFLLFAGNQLSGLRGYLQTFQLLDGLMLMRPHLPGKIREYFPVTEENLGFYLNMMQFFHGLLRIAGSTCRLSPLQDWRKMAMAMDKLYCECVKEHTSAWKEMQRFGYTKEEILDLNCGTYFYWRENEDSECPPAADSTIKFNRQVREWFQARLRSSKPVPGWVREIMGIKKNSMKRKIDGTDSEKRFFFIDPCGKPEDYPCLENRSLLFVLTRWLDKNTGAYWKIQQWMDMSDADCMSPCFDPEKEENQAFLKALPGYLLDAVENGQEDTMCTRAHVEKSVMRSCIRRVMTTKRVMGDWEYPETKKRMEKVEALFGRSVKELVMEYANEDVSCKELLYEMIHAGEASLLEYCLYKTGMQGDISIGEALYLMDRSRRIVVKQYIRDMESPKAYKALVSTWDEAKEKRRDFCVLRGMHMDVNTLVKRLEAGTLSFLSKEQQEDLCRRVMECAFILPGEQDTGYMETAAQFLCCKEARGLFPEAECRELYQQVRTEVKKELADRLDQIFLSREELEKEKEWQEKQKKERAEKKKQEERQDAVAYYHSMMEREDGDAGKLCSLMKSYGHYYDPGKKILMEAVHGILDQNEHLSMPRKELAYVLGKMSGLWAEGCIGSYEELLAIFSRFSEEKQEEQE